MGITFVWGNKATPYKSHSPAGQKNNHGFGYNEYLSNVSNFHLIQVQRLLHIFRSV